MSVWEEIKSRLSVEEVIGEYISIQSAGSSYRCLCPFHNERTPSMMISPNKGIWHCFGCGEGGDIFAFVSKIENITKQEALTKLAKRAGVKLDPIKPNNESERTPPIEQTYFEQGLKILEWAGDIYHKILLKILSDRNHPVTQYCIDRGLNLETIEKFRIGYAPRDFIILTLSQKYNIPLQLLSEVGLLKEKVEGGYKDKFFDRLIIPITNEKHQTIAFTARVLPYDNSERPKYLNSSQSPWFNKSEIWFGLNLARPQIIKEKKAIIVEGNMDVIAAHQAGLTFTIASQGTAFTQHHLSQLKRLTRTVWLAFDNDNAGITASKKFFAEGTKIGIEILRVIIPQEYKDLDEYISLNKEKINIKTMPFIEYMIALRHSELTSSDAPIQKTALLEILDMISYVDPISREQYARSLSHLTKISSSTLLSQIKRIEKVTTDDELNTQSNEGISLDKVVLVTWQKLLAYAYYVQKEDKENSLPNLNHMFELLKSSIKELEQYDSVESYFALKKDELELIANEHPILEEECRNLVKTILLYLDRQLPKFLLDEKLKSLYANLKQEITR